MPSIFRSLIPSVTIYKFKPDEHKKLGDEVVLYRLNSKGKKVKIKKDLPIYTYDEKREAWRERGRLSYGEIVALAEDYFSTSEPVSKGKNIYVREATFVEHYNEMAQSSVRKRKKIFKIANSRWSNSIIQTLRYTIEAIGPGYLKLLLQNVDHFSPNAWKAYEVGHAVALDLACKAYRLRNEGNHSESEKYLHLAYAMNAFACHFLSDMFSGGHALVPRQALTDKFGAIPGGLISNGAHNHDGKKGASVQNEYGDQWVLFGDGNFNISANEKNRFLIALAMQASANEIYETYETGVRPETREVEKHIPSPDTLVPGDEKARPLFREKDGKLQIYKKPKESAEPTEPAEQKDFLDKEYKSFGKLTVMKYSPTLFRYLVRAGAASGEDNVITPEERASLEGRLKAMQAKA